MTGLKDFVLAAVTATLFAPIGTTFVSADPVADFYKGKQLTIAVGYAPGGAYDVYTRLLGRHFGKHVPGNPTVVVQNMPGAGSLRAANFVYNVAPKDGTTLGVFSASTALEPLFGNKSAKFETVKFTWIGNMYRDVASCGTWRNSGINSFQDVINSKKELSFGATGPGALGNQHALVLKNMLGVKLKVVTGYPGIANVGLALGRGEVQAACALSLSTVKSSFMRPLKDGDLKIFIQFGKQNQPLFGNATNFYSLLKTDEQRQVADLFFGQSEISRPIIGPPGLPPAIAAALRRAMMDALKDPALQADAAKLGVDIDPVDALKLARAELLIEGSCLAFGGSKTVAEWYRAWQPDSFRSCRRAPLIGNLAGRPPQLDKSAEDHFWAVSRQLSSLMDSGASCLPFA